MGNLSKEEILKKHEEIQKEARELGFDLTLDISDIKPYRQDAIWYGGNIGTLEYGNFLICIDVVGDVNATLLDENDDEIASVYDKNNEGKFFEVMSPYIEDDERLFEYQGYTDTLTNRNLVFENNNWLEYRIIDKKTDEYIDLGLNGGIIDSNDVLEAFTDLDYYIHVLQEMNLIE